jgi:hypothetical protein
MTTCLDPRKGANYRDDNNSPGDQSATRRIRGRGAGILANGLFGQAVLAAVDNYPSLEMQPEAYQSLIKQYKGYALCVASALTPLARRPRVGVRQKRQFHVARPRRAPNSGSAGAPSHCGLS